MTKLQAVEIFRNEKLGYVMQEINRKQIDEITDELNSLLTYNKNIQVIINDILKNNINSQYLSVTDPDMAQVGIKITDDIWLYSQSDDYIVDGESIISEDYDYDTDLMDFTQYSDEDIQNSVSGYNKDIDDVKKNYGHDWKQVALECAFEQRIIRFDYGNELEKKLTSFEVLKETKEENNND